MFCGVGLSALIGGRYVGSQIDGPAGAHDSRSSEHLPFVGPVAVSARPARLRRRPRRVARLVGALPDALGPRPSRRRREPHRCLRGRQGSAGAAVPGAVPRGAAGRDRRCPPLARSRQDVGRVDDGGARIHRGGPRDLLEVAAPARRRGGAACSAARSPSISRCRPSACPISPFLLDMLPYVLSLAVLAVWGGARRHAAPASLGTGVPAERLECG